MKTSSDFGANVTASNVGSDSATAAFSERHAAVGSASRRAILTVSLVSGTVTAPARITAVALRSRSIHCASRISGTVKPPAESVPSLSARRSSSLRGPVIIARRTVAQAQAPVLLRVLRALLDPGAERVLAAEHAHLGVVRGGASGHDGRHGRDGLHDRGGHGRLHGRGSLLCCW